MIRHGHPLFALMALLVVCAGIFLLIALPHVIAKSRNVSSKNLSTVDILTALGIFLGITWFVAIILACTYPEEQAQQQATATSAVTCGNCGRSLGKLETPNVIRGHNVCYQCYTLLKDQVQQ